MTRIFDAFQCDQDFQDIAQLLARYESIMYPDVEQSLTEHELKAFKLIVTYRLDELKKHANLRPKNFTNAYRMIANLLDWLLTRKKQLARQNVFIRIWNADLAGFFGINKVNDQYRRNLRDLTDQMVDECCLLTKILIEYLTHWQDPNKARRWFQNHQLTCEEYYEILALIHANVTLLQKQYVPDDGRQVRPLFEQVVTLYQQQVLTKPLFAIDNVKNFHSWRFTQRTLAKVNFYLARLEHNIKTFAANDPEKHFDQLQKAVLVIHMQRKKLIPIWHYGTNKKLKKTVAALEERKRQMALSALRNYVAALQEGGGNLIIQANWMMALPAQLANTVTLFVSCIRDPSQIRDPKKFEECLSKILDAQEPGITNQYFMRVMEDIVTNILSKRVLSTRDTAFPLICKYSKAKAFMILESSDTDIIQHLNNDDIAWRMGGGARKLAYLLNMDAMKNGFSEALTVIAIKLIKEHWFHEANHGRALRRLKSLLDFQKLDPPILLLFKWGNTHAVGQEPLQALRRTLEGVSNSEDDAHTWLASIEALYGLVQVLTDTNIFGRSSTQPLRILLDFAAVLARKLRQHPDIPGDGCLEFVLSEFSKLDGIVPQDREIFQNTLQRHAAIAEISKLDELEAALKRNVLILQIHQPEFDRRHIQSLVEFQFDKAILEKLYLEARTRALGEQLTFLIPALVELSRLPRISESLLRQLKILITVLSAGNSRQHSPDAAITAYFHQPNAELFLAMRRREGGPVEDHVQTDGRGNSREAVINLK